MLAHIPNSVDPERNMSSLKLTLTKQHNCLGYDALNVKMQCTENGPATNTDECEKILGEVAENVLSGGYTAQGFRANEIQYMKNCQ